VDTGRFRPAPWPATPRLLHVGDLEPAQGQPVLLEAFAAVVAAAPEARLHLVGHGPELIGLRRLARALGVADAVIWRGQVPHAAMPLVYAGAGAFVLSAWDAGQGLVLAEAAAAGLPIASTRVGMAPDLPAAGTHLAAAGEARELAAAMLAALETGPARELARRALRQCAESAYDLDPCGARLEALLRHATAA
jgi:glycosyltransferase involved in cell wall biosynthesis